MGFNATPYTVTTLLLVVFAVFVIYTRIKGWLDSNVPLIFYVILIAYMRAVEGAVPLYLMLAAFAMGLLLRFEFLNASFIKVFKYLEIAMLAAIIYFCLTMIFTP